MWHYPRVALFMRVAQKKPPIWIIELSTFILLVLTESWPYNNRMNITIATLSAMIMVQWRMGPYKTSFLYYRATLHFHDSGRKGTVSIEVNDTRKVINLTWSILGRCTPYSLAFRARSSVVVKIIWATRKNPPTFHYTGWFIGILILAY